MRVLYLNNSNIRVHIVYHIKHTSLDGTLSSALDIIERAIRLELILDKDEPPRPEVFQTEKRSLVPLDQRIGPQMSVSNGQPKTAAIKPIPTGPANRPGTKCV